MKNFKAGNSASPKLDLLPASFFERSTLTVARELIGQNIVTADSVLRIVEAEAYLGPNDPASHAFRGPTQRAKIMFGPAGAIYIYLIYGNYFMLNFVTEREGAPGAVLIRAVEPISGIETLLKRRPVKKIQDLTNGPAKLVLALGVDITLNGKMLGVPHLAVAEGSGPSGKIIASSRIGINAVNEGRDFPFRFYDSGSSFVSGDKRSGSSK